MADAERAVEPTAEGEEQQETPEVGTEDWSCSGFTNYFVEQVKSPRFWVVLVAFIAVEIAISLTDVDLEWHWLSIYGFLLLGFTSITNSPRTFFRGDVTEKTAVPQSYVLLSGSTFVTWVFAKSINNSAGLGGRFGLLGGFAYAGWYVSFFSAAIVIYRLRGMGYKSLPEAVNARYGRLAALSFGIAVLYRLLNEVWSNSIVVAGFYGAPHSGQWWAAGIVSTLIPLLYVFGGGLRMSLTSDLLQAVIMIIFLCIMLAFIEDNRERPFHDWQPGGECPEASKTLAEGPCLQTMLGNNFTKAAMYVDGVCTFPKQYKNTVLQAASGITDPALCTSAGGVWTAAHCDLLTQYTCDNAGYTWKDRSWAALASGWDILIVAVMQGALSYPFYDPVLTDRAFLGPRKVMRAAFFTGGTIAAAFIICFGLFGAFGHMEATLRPDGVGPDLYANMRKGKSEAVADFMGTGLYQVIVIIFITSSISTLDSTFSSTAKICGPEFAGLISKGAPEIPQNANSYHLLLGRIAMVVLAVAGTLHLIDDVEELSATTVSGTMVMGLGPPIFGLLFMDPEDPNAYRPLLFHMPFWCGVAFGIVYQLQKDDCCQDWMLVEGFDIGNGVYNRLLGFNVYGTMCCWILAALAAFEYPAGWPRPSWVVDGVKRCFGIGYPDPDEEEDPVLADLEKEIKANEPASDSTPEIATRPIETTPQLPAADV